MLRTNFSTRPFYNVRAVRAALGLAALVIVAISVFIALQTVRLTLSERTLGERAAQAEGEAERLRADAARIRAQIDPAEVAVVAAAANEANALIDQRAFSWTQLLAQFEETLPEDVRLTAIRPRTERDGRIIVGAIVEAREVEDLDAFIEALEKTGTFHNVLPTEIQTDDDGLVEAVIEGVYTAPRAITAETAPSGAPGE